MRIHRTTGRRPLDLWKSEPLTAVGAVPAYKLAEEACRRVDAEGMVAYHNSRYSVPPEHTGKTVTVAAHSGRIVIRCADMILAEHAEATKPGSSVVIPEHAAALWKMSLQRHKRGAPPPSWQLRFDQQVASRPLDFYAEVAR